ncbi:unnamed protein product [Sphagnum tenellum]
MQSPLNLHDQVRDMVPSLWDPKALASFIEKYGTHIIVGVVIGGKDVSICSSTSIISCDSYRGSRSADFGVCIVNDC